MKLSTIEIIIKTLNHRRIRYLIAGGLAVVAHGYVRFTADLDLILDLEYENLRAAMMVFGSLGYRPRAPVELEDFVHLENRNIWAREKGMTVFSLWSPDHPATEIDLFVEEPIPFEEAYKRSMLVDVAEGIEATVIGLDDLITLKRRAGRTKDIDDIEKLTLLGKQADHE